MGWVPMKFSVDVYIYFKQMKKALQGCGLAILGDAGDADVSKGRDGK